MNILLINIDDMGWSDLGCQGSTYYRTPNIDRLAAQGMRFTDAYAPAANCAPSRACLLTGQNTPRHGIYTVNSSERGKSKDRALIPTPNTRSIQDENLTFAHALRAAGYHTATMGKWHISDDPTRNGFDVNVAGNHGGGPYLGGYHSPFDYPNCKQEDEGEYLTDRLTDEAIQYIEAHRNEKWLLYLPHYAVHTPLQAKEELRQRYADRPATEAHHNPVYAAMIESVDEGIGRLMKCLDELGLAGNTIVIFTSDNGGLYRVSKQWPLRAGKGSYFEGGIRVPFLVRWPGKVAAGSVSNVPVTHMDLFPTFLEMTGAAAPRGKQLDGDSILPVLTGAGQMTDRPLFFHFPVYLQNGNAETHDTKFRTRPGSVVRLGDWKLHEYFEDGRLEFYNLAEDIGERNNLAAARPDKARELHGILKAWRQRTNAPVPTERNPEFRG